MCGGEWVGGWVDIVSGHMHGLNIDTHYRNKPNKSKLALYKPLIHFNSHQMYISITS